MNTYVRSHSRRRGTIRNSIPGIRALGEALKELTLPAADDAVRRERDSTIAFLSNLLGTFKALKDPFLSDCLLKQLQIEIHQGLSGERVRMGPFFSPWSAERINAHLNIMEKTDTGILIRLTEQAIGCGPPIPGLMDGPAGHIFPCHRKPGPSLANISGWDTRSKKSPHVKVLMSNLIEAKDVLSREEVFVIAYMMIHRLQSDGMENHVIAPVMLLSIMAECHGRILIAHFDGAKLVIQMLKLHCSYSGYKE
ncbi:hypothetical protein BJX96DRAFT_166329 [Aspergillus floccosus]